jgi:hypothetical protein
MLKYETKKKNLFFFKVIRTTIKKNKNLIWYKNKTKLNVKGWN